MRPKITAMPTKSAKPATNWPPTWSANESRYCHCDRMRAPTSRRYVPARASASATLDHHLAHGARRHPPSEPEERDRPRHLPAEHRRHVDDPGVVAEEELER